MVILRFIFVLGTHTKLRTVIKILEVLRSQYLVSDCEFATPLRGLKAPGIVVKMFGIAEESFQLDASTIVFLANHKESE